MLNYLKIKEILQMKLNSLPMQNKIKYILTTILATVLLVSCSKDNPDYPNGSGSATKDEIGYLSFEKFNVIADSDLTEDFNDGQKRSVTRAEVAVDAYIIRVMDDKDSIVYTSTYKDAIDLGEDLKLEIGLYKVSATSTDEIPLTAWDTPTFYGERSFVINKNQKTTVDNLVCEVSNIKTTLELSADLKELFKADDEATVPMSVVFKLGEDTMSFSRTETRAAFFKAKEDNNTIKITLKGEYNTAAADETPSYEIITWTQTINNVKAGQWRKVNIKMDNTNSGNVRFVIEVETWTYDDEIDVDVVRFFSLARYEEEIEDPYDTTTDIGSAILSLGGGYNINNPINVDKNAFVLETNTCIKPIFMYVTPATGVTVKKVEIFSIESDNQALLDKFGDEKIQIFPTNELSTDMVISEDANNVVKSVATNSGMLKLYSYAGTHKVMIKTVDSENRRSFTELTINVSADALPAVGPEAIWRGGKEFGTLYNVSDLTDLIIDIESATGITKFKVNIIGDVVNDEALTDPAVGLGRELDLVNPGDKEAGLNTFGFPVKDAVEGKNTLTFDISSFLPMLGGLVTATGDVTFALTVGDASGEIYKEIKLHVVL